VIILHGGPDFDHNYLLPDMDRLADAYRLIYYDQRGRGRSAENVKPDDVSLESEIADLEVVREYFQLESVAVLGHSWGGLLAMEYAIRHPERVSHLILINTGPASHDDYTLFRQNRLKSAAGDIERMKALASTARYQEGDLEADAAYYRIHFKSAICQPEQLEKLVLSLRANFNQEGIRKAREIEARLMEETWSLRGYTLFTQLGGLRTPTLLIHGDYDIIPVAYARHIAQAIPGASLVVLKETGHFSFIENPDGVRKAIDDFFRGA